MNNSWNFFDVDRVPKNVFRNETIEEWEGKEIYVFQREHPDYGLMSITVLASNVKEARQIIADVTK